MRPKFALGVAAIVLPTALLFAAMAGHFEPDTSSFAIVDDVTHMKSIGDAYCLVSVDGAPVERRRGRFVTMVPVALADPGERTLRLQLDRESPDSLVVLNAKLERGQRYRLAFDDATLHLVEVRHHQQQPK